MTKRVYSLLLIFLAVPCSVSPQLGSLVGTQAPAFTASAVVNGEITEISLADYEGKNKILIFYPADFSFICPTELFAFQDKLAEFEKRNTQLLAISVDQVYSHQKWLEIPKDQGGIKGIMYPLISDITKIISQSYQTLDHAKGTALRGIIIIDTHNVIQVSAVYNTSIGRNIDEVLRILDAILFTQEHGQVCPADWEKGKAGMEANEEGLKSYLKETKNKEGKS